MIKFNYTGIVDVGTGKPTKVIDLATAAGYNVPIKQVVGEQLTSCADTTILASRGWQPSRNVLEDIKNDIV